METTLLSFILVHYLGFHFFPFVLFPTMDLKNFLLKLTLILFSFSDLNKLSFPFMVFHSFLALHKASRACILVYYGPPSYCCLAVVLTISSLTSVSISSRNLAAPNGFYLSYALLSLILLSVLGSDKSKREVWALSSCCYRWAWIARNCSCASSSVIFLVSLPKGLSL